MGTLLNETGDVVTQDMEKTEVLSSFFTRVFIRKTSLQALRSQRKKVDNGWSKADLLLVKKIRSGKI